jgi:hypothetical protein
MNIASWKTSKTLGGIALAFEGMCVSEIKPTIFKFFSLLNLSLSPNVVGALAPTVKCSFHSAIPALGVAERADSANSLSQAPAPQIPRGR